MGIQPIAVVRVITQPPRQLDHVIGRASSDELLQESEHGGMELL